MIASNSASSSANEVRIRHWISSSRGADLAAHLDAVPVGQPHVDDRDVGLRRRDARQRLLGGPRLADDLDVVALLEELAHAAAHDLVIVEQEHSNRHRQLTSVGAGDRGSGHDNQRMPR